MGHDVAYAFRLLFRDPGFAPAVLLILAIGGGANIAVYALVDAVLLQPLPYRNPDRLVRLWETNASNGVRYSPVSDGTLTDWQHDLTSFDGVEGFMPQPRDSIVQIDGDPEIAREGMVTSGFMELLGVPPVLGPAAHIRLSYRYWIRRFRGDPSVIGRRITLNGFTAHPGLIDGVMPSSFGLPPNADYWGWFTLNDDRNFRSWDAIGRLKPGVTIARAQNELDAISGRLAERYPAQNSGWRAVIMPLKESIVAPERTALLMIYVSVSLLFLIAASNVAVVFTARRLRQGRDLAIQLALGAGRVRLLRQSFVQCAALSALATAGGLLLAAWLLRLLVAGAPASIPRLAEVHVSGREAAVACMLGAFLALLLWAISAGGSRPSLDALRGTAGGSTNRSTHVVRSTVVRIEVACCACLLLVAAGAVRTFVELQRAPLGFVPAGVLLVDVMQPIMKAGEVVKHYPTRRFLQTAERVTAFAARLPGVTAAAVATAAPLAKPPSRRTYRVLDHAITGPPNTDAIVVAGTGARPVATTLVGPGFFKAAGIALVAGRAFTPDDRLTDQQIDDFDADRGAGAAIVSAAFAKELGSIPSMIGRYLQVSGAVYRSVWVVGVAADVVTTPGKPVEPLLYLPYAQDPRDGFTLVVRAASPNAVASPLNDYLRRSLGTDVSGFNLRAYDDVIGTALAAARFSSRVMTLFGAAAAAFTAVALYSVLTLIVVLRRRELAIRLALGADPRALRSWVINQGLRLAVAGTVVGVAGGVALIRMLGAALPGVHPASPTDVIATAALTVLVAVAASFRPAWAASRADPLPALKFD